MKKRIEKKGNIFNEKKGLTGVVTTIIVILLVLFAVAVVWLAVKNVVQKGAEQINLGKLTLDLEIEKVRIEQDGVTATVFVRRNPGAGDLSGINFIFFDGSNTETIRQEVTLQEGERKTFTLKLTKMNGDEVQRVSIAPIFSSDTGKEIEGDVAHSLSKEEIAVMEFPDGPFKELGFVGAGKTEYSISGKGDQINFTKAIVDPLDVLPGDNQSFTVHISSTYTIADVTSVTELDNSTLYLDFAETGPNIWSANWIVNDTHTTEYRTHVTATDSEGNSNSITLTWTDSCQSQIIQGQDSTIDQNCTTGIDSIAGLDSGDLTIAEGKTLTIDSGSTFIFNSGKSITVGGTISISGGTITKGNLFYIDVDGDNYRKNSTLFYSDSASLSERVRAKDSLGDDCYDNNASAKPGQTTYFATDRGDGSFDFDCDMDETQRWDNQCTVNIKSVTEGWDNSTAVPACGVSGDFYGGTDCLFFNGTWAQECR